MIQCQFRRFVCLFLCTLVLIFPAALMAQEAEEAPASESTGETKEATYKNTLKWSTSSEEDNFGFDIYRGDSEEGPFERLTEQPLLGGGTTDEPLSYEYVDDTIDPYAVYWYYVESISMSGNRERFTPIFASKPKLTRDAQDGEDVAEAEDEAASKSR